MDDLKDRIGQLTIQDLWDAGIISNLGWIKFFNLVRRLFVNEFKLRDKDTAWLMEKVAKKKEKPESKTKESTDSWPIMP